MPYQLDSQNQVQREVDFEIVSFNFILVGTSQFLRWRVSE